MKKIYSFLLGAFALTTTVAQTGWTVYSYTTSTNIPNATFNSIAIDQTGNIWAGSSYSGIVKYNGTNWSKFTQSNSNILHDFTNDILVDNSNKIWVGNYKGVSVYNGTTFTNYDTINASFNGSEVYSLGKDNNGVIWLASKIGSFGYKGLTTYNGTTWTNLTGLPSQVVNDEFNDYVFTSTNEAWIANGGGMLKYNGTFTFYPKATTGLWDSKSIAKDASGNIWAGGFDGLLRYSSTGTTWTMRDNIADLGLTSNTFFYDILVDGNYLWLATSSGLLKFNMTTGVIVANYKAGNSPLTTNCVTRLAKDASGKIWMATTIGIVKMDPTLVIGIEEISSQGPFKIYPNPSTGLYNFSYDGFTNLNYKIYSAKGTLVSEGKAGSSNFQINLKNEASGMYFVHINTENSDNQVIKLIKE
ncbi:MAG: T9SS type A sorting domain-containing protein [Burkholderiales bacterium]|nr:T9SS type A sorting domain-containing protein [Bacteroidia bacterium]